MQRKAQQFLAAFLIGTLFVAGLCGFALVDLRSERYMPESHGVLLRLLSLGEEGMHFAFLGEEYILAPSEELGGRLWEHRGLMPHSVTLTANLMVRIQEAVQEYNEARRQEEFW